MHAARGRHLHTISRLAILVASVAHGRTVANHTHWCREFHWAKQQPRHGHANHTRFEVLHRQLDQERLWHARWLYEAPGSGLWFDPGRTAIVRTHHEVNEFFHVQCNCSVWQQGKDNCAFKRKAFRTNDCPTVSPAAIDRARELGFDSIQILGHCMDLSGDGRRHCKFEVIDLSLPYINWPPDGTLMNNYYSDKASTEPCIKRTYRNNECPCDFHDFTGPGPGHGPNRRPEMLGCRGAGDCG